MPSRHSKHNPRDKICQYLFGVDTDPIQHLLLANYNYSGSIPFYEYVPERGSQVFGGITQLFIQAQKETAIVVKVALVNGQFCARDLIRTQIGRLK